jgi:hypothetical protein
VDDLDKLARACGRQGRWAEAAEAWHAEENLDRVNADKPRYAARVAALAAEVGILPSSSPTAFLGGLSREDLETLMSAQAAAVRAAKEAAAAAPGDPAVRAKQAAADRDGQAVAGLGGGGVRAARPAAPGDRVLGGWAPLLFQPAEWEIPPAP